jgi:hypothetical protein
MLNINRGGLNLTNGRIARPAESSHVMVLVGHRAVRILPIIAPRATMARGRCFGQPAHRGGFPSAADIR